ncbi:MAG: hypothetical protein NZ920_01740 [Aigarchaeota archaeon]|nr:hypothetical protein [Aigarchaeota archaeon]MDW8093165.1 hypothetical protein [Nitrososphaerota archaeon]
MCKMGKMLMNIDRKVRVKLTLGKVTVEIEAPPEELDQAIKRTISAITETQGQERPTSREEKRGVTCRELIERLIGEGWFDVPRSLSEVSRELARRGHFYDQTAVAHSLLDLVRSEVLVREGLPRRYTYVARKDRGIGIGQERVMMGEEGSSDVDRV